MDIELLEKIVSGDQDAFSQLFEETYQDAYRLAYSYCKNASDAEDAVQEAYIKVFNKINTLKDLKAFKSWFNMIIVNTAKNVSVKNNRNPYNFSQLENEDDDLDFEDSLENDDVSFMPEESLDIQELIVVMGKIVADINADQRICLQLFYYNGMKIKEIAEALDISESTVKTRLRLGKAKVEAKVEEYEKKGYKFHGILFFPFFNASVGETVVPTLTFKTFILPFITEAAKGTAAAALGSAAATKIIIGITATVVVAVGITTAVFFSHNDTPPETTAPVYAVVEQTIIPTTENIQIEKTTNGSTEEPNTVNNTVAETTTQQTGHKTNPAQITHRTSTTYKAISTANKTNSATSNKTEISNDSYPDFKYIALGSETAEITKYTGSETNLVVPSKIDGKKIISIGSQAFAGNQNLKSIVIADEITNIGDYAFFGCSNLSNITLPKGLTKIREGVFCDCDRLTDFTIPNSIKSIGDGAFRYCENLKTITISQSVESIDWRAFIGCTSLKNINVNTKNSVFSSSNGILYNKNKTEILRYPEGKTEKSFSIPNKIEKIKDGAFEYCDNLTSVTIPNSVKNIGYAAFSGCSNLKSIKIPNSVTTIEDYAFDDCSKLKTVTISENCKTIGSGAFKGAALEEVVLPKSVERIEGQAFCCMNLDKITILNTKCYIDEGYASTIIGTATIYGYKNSTAEKFANKNYRQFVALN